MSRAEIATEAMALDPGQSMRVVCPFCGGGSSGERSMSIKRDSETGLVLYHCFRGNCEEGSGVLGGARLVRTRLAPPRFTPFDCSGLIGIEDAPGKAHTMLLDWRLNPACHGMRGFKYDTYSDRVAMPVWGPIGDLRGYVLRAWAVGHSPKVLTGRLTNNGPFQCWHRQPGSGSTSILCVEDIPSAIRVAEAGHDCVALLGNTPSDDAMDEIAYEANYTGVRRPVVWALDPDATGQAIRLNRSYGLRGSSSVLVLEKDFKNMTQEEVHECLMNVP